MSNKSKKPSFKEMLQEKKDDFKPLPLGAVLADHEKLVHINTYGELPKFYIDRPFVCKDCSIEQIWTAKQQKWWFEEAKGHIDSFAVRCRECRQNRKENNKK